MFCSLSELDGFSTPPWVFVVVALAIFVMVLMVLLTFLNSRRARINSEKVLKHTAQRLVGEQEENAELAAEAEKAKRQHRDDLAQVRKEMATLLRDLGVTVSQFAAIAPPLVQHIRSLEQGPVQQQLAPGWTPPNGQLAARQVTPRALPARLVRQPDLRPTPRPLRGEEETPGAPGAAQPDVPAFVPIKAYERKAPSQTDAAWFDPKLPTTVAPQGGDYDARMEETAFLPASHAADEPAVRDGEETEPTGGSDHEGTGAWQDALSEPVDAELSGRVDDGEPLETAAGEETLTEPVPTQAELPTTPLDTEAVSAEAPKASATTAAKGDITERVMRSSLVWREEGAALTQATQHMVPVADEPNSEAERPAE